MIYSNELTKAMTWLGEQPDTVFIGQGIKCGGHAMYKTLVGVCDSKCIEMPVAEEMQLGMSIGMSLTGLTVISIFPRFDFLLLAMNQLINHLDKLDTFTHGQYHAKVIIRVGIGSKNPLDPGCQHSGDYTDGLKIMLKRTNILRLDGPDGILDLYEVAYRAPNSSLMVEDMSLYDG